jgi:hypothetical protein
VGRTGPGFRRSALLVILNLLLQLANHVCRLPNCFVALFQLFDKQTVNPHQFFVLFFQSLRALNRRPHTLNLSVQFRLIVSPVVKLQLEVEVLLHQAIHLLVQFSHTRRATLASSNAEGGATVVIAHNVRAVSRHGSQGRAVV